MSVDEKLRFLHQLGLSGHDAFVYSEFNKKDPNGHGFLVVPAVEGKAAYVVGYQVAVDGAVDVHLVSRPAHPSNKQIGVNEKFAAATTSEVRTFPIAVPGDEGRGVGFVADSTAVEIDAVVWGYYA